MTYLLKVEMDLHRHDHWLATPGRIKHITAG